ncbi:MAG: SDR family NAD(P)-dependent oxidoreductase [Candidatus Cyclobacteriaceae bacterium M3_2C_046]
MKEQDQKILLLTLLGAGAVYLTRYFIRKKQSYDFKDKIVLITGGSRGLGLEMARQLLQLQAKVVICARSLEELKKAKKELLMYGNEVLTIKCDVTQRDEVDEMIKTIYNTFDHIDVLVNNAGAIQVGPVEAMRYTDYDEALATNFWAPLHTTLAVLPQMKERNEGRIINISSLGGKVSIPHLLPYSVSKFALTGFSEGLHAELKKDGILVTTACPGLTRTGGYHFAKTKGEVLKEYDWFSTADTMPLLSAGVEYTAGQIINSCAHGEAEIVVSLPARLIVGLNGLFPGMVSDLFTLFNDLLPPPEDSLQENDDIESIINLPSNGNGKDQH